jgi:Family of unknown function (DUF6338)
MLVTAAEVADSLALLIPGFVLMKVFYLLGFQTKRSDAQWVIWSVLATAPILWTASALSRSTPVGLPVAIALGVGGGAALSLLWRALIHFVPAIGSEVNIRAWDNVLGGGERWIQVELTDGRTFRGWHEYAARSVDTDDLDLYLRDPAAVVKDDYVALDGVEGLLLERSQIVMVAVFDESDPPPAPTPGRTLRASRGRARAAAESRDPEQQTPSA